MTAQTESVDVVVVGAGPAGLTAAAELRRRGVPSVVVLDREVQAGGIPRHSDHTGFGVRDLRRLLSGPAYARRLVQVAESAGAQIRTRSMVTGWADGSSLLVTSPQGRYRLDAGVVVLATGARERPRSARLVPGDRPAGVLTTGQLQNAVHLHGRPVDGPAVIVGSELVSWSAAMTLREAGCRSPVMVTPHPRPEAYGAFAVTGRVALGVDLRTHTRVTRILGHDRVEAVELTDLATGRRYLEPCSTVVFTGDWIPDHELARLRGIEIDPAHRGPLVDAALRTSAPGVFAIGNLVHPVDTADVAALDGRHVAGAVAAHLESGDRRLPAVRLRTEAPFRWVTPGWLRPDAGAPPRHRLLLWADEHHRTPQVEARQGASVIGRRRLPWPVSPGRMFRVPWSLVADADPEAGDVTLSLA
jgi:thioredoxin reductase